MEMVFNGLFMMILLFVHFPSMKPDAIYSLEPVILLNGEMGKDMDIHLISPLMPLLRMNHGSIAMKNLLRPL